MKRSPTCLSASSLEKEWVSTMETPPINKAQPLAAVEPIGFSNGVRLSDSHWLIVGLFTAVLIVFAPILWKHFEPRHPYAPQDSAGRYVP